MECPFEIPKKYKKWLNELLKLDVTIFGGLLRDRKLSSDIDMVVCKNQKQVRNVMRSLPYVRRIRGKNWYNIDLYQETYKVFDTKIDLVYVKPNDFNTFLELNQDFTVNSLCFNQQFGLFVKPTCPYSIIEIQEHIQNMNLFSLPEIGRVSYSFYQRTSHMLSKGYIINFTNDNETNFRKLACNLLDIDIDNSELAILLVNKFRNEIVNLDLTVRKIVCAFPYTINQFDVDVSCYIDNVCAEKILFYDIDLVPDNSWEYINRNEDELFDRAIDCGYERVVSYFLGYLPLKDEQFCRALSHGYMSIVEIMKEYVKISPDMKIALQNKTITMIGIGNIHAIKILDVWLRKLDDNPDDRLETLPDLLSTSSIIHPRSIVYLTENFKSFKINLKLVWDSVNSIDFDMETCYKLFKMYIIHDKQILIKIIKRFPHLSQLICETHLKYQDSFDIIMENNDQYWFSRLLPIEVDLYRIYL